MDQDAPALPDNIRIIDVDGRLVHLVGTAHVSEASVHEVRQVIRDLRPDTVCVELDQGRYEALTDDSRWRRLDVFKVIREGKTLFLLVSLAIAAWQKRLGDRLGVKPGAELLAATEEATAIGAKVVLIDRDVHITLKRTWRNLSFLSKAKLLGAFLAGGEEGEIESKDIEKLKDNASLSQAMEELGKMLPEVKEPLIDERDRYMIAGIRAAEGARLVAVVGAAHVGGMIRHLHTEVDRAKLDVLPPPARWTQVVKWILPALILYLFWRGAQAQHVESFRQVLTAWILPNSIFCALLTAIAGGKPLSVLAGFIASPITSLNPMVPAGLVVGLLEAWLRKPTVEDAEAIPHAIESLRGIYANRATRVLLVTVASTLGSAMGAWVGLGWLFSLVSG
ncbi:MAG: hypothetical protein AMXMBFR64_11310 [Myxococcales bacterium]